MQAECHVPVTAWDYISFRSKNSSSSESKYFMYGLCIPIHYEGEMKSDGRGTASHFIVSGCTCYVCFVCECVFMIVSFLAEDRSPG